MLPPLRNLLLILAPGSLLLLLGLGAVLTGRIPIDASVNVLLAGDSRNLETYNKLNSLAASSTKILVMAKREPHWYSNEGARLINELTYSLMRLDHIREVKSLTSTGRPVIPPELRPQMNREIAELRQNMSNLLTNPFQLMRKLQRFRDYISIQGFFPLSLPEESLWREVRKFNEAFPLSRNVMISENGQWASFVLFIGNDFSDRFDQHKLQDDLALAMTDIDGDIDDWKAVGMPLVETEVLSALEKNLLRYLLLFVGLSMLALILTFRSPLILLLVLLFEGLGLAGLGLVFLLTQRPPNLYTLLLLPLVCGLQMTFLAHFFSAMQSFKKRSVPAPVSAALAEVFRPSMLAVFSTMIGLLSLLLTSNTVLREFGWLGALAVAAVAAITFVPLFLVTRKEHPTFGSSGSATDEATWHLPLPPPPLILGLGAALVILAIVLFPKIRTDIRAKEFLSAEMPIRSAVDIIDEHMGGMNIFQLRMQTDQPYGIQQPEVLAYLETLRSEAKKIDGVTETYAYSQLFTVMNEQLNPEVDNFETLPDPINHQLIRALVNAGGFLFKDAFTDSEARWGLFILRTRDMPAEDYLTLVDSFKRMAEAVKPAGVQVSAEQGLDDILRADREVMRSLLRSLGPGLIVILLLLSLIWRDIWLGSAVVLTNLLPLATVGLVLGGFNIPLNSLTIMVVAILIGIAVDDSIHFVSYYRDARREGLAIRTALERTLARKVKPMACTTGVLMAALGLVWIFPFPPVAHAGVLSAASLSAALAAACFVLPALLRAKGEW